MHNTKKKIAPFHCLKGKDATEKLKQLLGLLTDAELAEYLNISPENLTTCQSKNLTPIELILKASTATGANIQTLALNQGEFFNNNNKKIIMIPAKRIQNGQIESTNSIALDNRLLPEQFCKDKLSLFITDNGHYIVDCSHCELINGRYVIEIEGQHSINRLKSLPSNKLSVEVADMPIIFDKAQVTILGKVISSITQEY